MRPAAHLLSVATLTALLVPVLEVAASAAQKSSLFEETRFLPIPEMLSTNGDLTGIESLRLEATPPQRLAQENSRQAEADRLFDQGLEQSDLGQFQEALESWEQALAIYREIGDRPGERLILNNLGVAYNHLGQYEQAINFHEQALAIARELGDRTGEGGALGNLGVAYNHLGQYEQAINFHEQALAIARELGDRTGEGGALGNLGITYNNLSQYERAIN